MSDPWIYKMTITKWRVHRDTGEVKLDSGWTKVLDATDGVVKKAPVKERKVVVKEESQQVFI